MRHGRKGPMVTRAMRDHATAPKARYIRPTRTLKKSGSLGHSSPPPLSPEVQAVFDRMGALSNNEARAIESMVDGMVADFTYQNVFEIWAPCLNSQDHLTGFKIFGASEINVIGSVTHFSGDGVRIGNATSGWLMNTSFNSIGLPDYDSSGAFFYYTNEGSYNAGANNDYCGLTAGVGEEAYIRNRDEGSSFDIDSSWNQTAATPRVATVGLLHEDLCGWGTETGAESLVMHPGGIIDSAARTFGTPNVAQFCWMGRNNGGTPEFSPVGMHRFFMFVDKPTGGTILLIRSRVLQFLRDIGVKGVPAP